MEAVSDSGSCLSFLSLSPPPPPPPAASAADSLPPDIEALRRLSSNLASLFLSQSPVFSDLTLTVHSRSLFLHRCVLASRSPFFCDLLTERGDGSGSKLDLGEVLRGYAVGYEALVLVLGYIYGGKVDPLPRGVCECADEECGHVGCWPAVDFMLQVLFASSTFEIPELVNLFQRHLLGILGSVDVDDMPVILSVANLCGTSCGRLFAVCTDMVVNSNLDAVTLEKALPNDIARQILDSRASIGGTEDTTFPDIHSKRLHKAIESDDIELVKLLLEEGHATLDSAYALHYAVAHCNSKITTELLELNLADVNRKNLRGYSVLHLAAKRQEPEVIMCLLDKGARSYDFTSDGRKALQISKQLTKALDYIRQIEQCKDAPKDRLCIEILDQAERRDPPMREASNSVVLPANEQLQKLLYLEIRVHMAKLLYPMEARVAMVNAQVDGTSEFTLSKVLSVPGGIQGPTVNEIPFEINEEHLCRMKALSKTVELGKRYFPRCAEVISRLLDHDSSELSNLENNTTEVRRKRYLELQEEIMEAFLQDKKELDGSVLCSSSSKSVGRARVKSARKCR